MGHPAVAFYSLISCSLFPDFQHYAESCIAGHHALVGFFSFFEGVDLVYRFDAGEGAEFEGVF